MTARRHRFYLCGAIQHASDMGRGWRVEVTEELACRGFASIDPLDIEKKMWDGVGIKEGDFDALYEVQNRAAAFALARGFLRKDLAQIESSDGLIVKFDKALKKGSGSYGEMSVAHYIGKPVYIYLGEDCTFKDVGLWIIGLATAICDTREELYGVLEEEYGRREG